MGTPADLMDAMTSPTVQLATDSIRAKIRRGEYKAGAYLPPELKLASDIGVSRGTVRRAIDVLVATGAIHRQPFSRPTIASIPVSKSQMGNEVHVWISRPIANSSSLRFLRGISSSLMGTRFQMVVREPVRFYGDHVKHEEREFLTNLLGNTDAAGAILERDPFAENTDLFELLVEQGKHLVFVDISMPPGLAADHVGTANIVAARKCVNHLLDQGHHNIAFVCDSDVPPSTQDRRTGYRRAMQQAGLQNQMLEIVASETPKADSVKMPVGATLAGTLSPGSHFRGLAQRAVIQLLAADPRPTALFVSCDALASWICSFVEGAGLFIPNDIAVVGFDWLARWGDPQCDILSSASQDFEGFGYHAADLIMQRATGSQSLPSRHILLDAPLMVRSSSVLTRREPSTSETDPSGQLRA